MRLRRRRRRARDRGHDAADGAPDRAPAPAPHLVRGDRRCAAIVVFIFYNPVLHFLSGPYQDVTAQHARAAAATGCKLIVTDPLAPFLVRLKIARLRRPRAVGARSSCGRSGASSCPGLHQQRAALRGRVRRLGDRPVRCSAASSPGSRSPRPSTFLLGVGGSSLRPAHRRQQVPDARDADVRGVRVRVRVPAAAGVPDAGRGGEHPPAPRTAGAGRPSGSRRLRRSSLRARIRSPYCSWPFPCTSSTRPRSSSGG